MSTKFVSDFENSFSHFAPIRDKLPLLFSNPDYTDSSISKVILSDTTFQILLTTGEMHWKDVKNSSLDNYDQNGLNYSDSSSSAENQESKILPIDMQFNDGNRLAIIMYSVLFLISAIGNIYVLTTILRWRKRQGRLTSLNLLLSHLATADLLVTFLMMPMEIAWNFTVSWKAGDVFCRILSFTRIFGLYLSGFILMCISIDRFYAVIYPLSIANSGARSRKMVCIAWFFTFVCSLPQAIIFHVESHPTFTWYQQCVTFNSFPSPDYEMAYNFFGFTFLYGVPLATVVLCYIKILGKIWNLGSLRRMEIEGNQLRRSSMGSIGRAKTQTIKMTVMILLTFFMCWAPYNVMSIWYWLDRSSASQVDQRIQKGLFLFACTNSCMNPVIYGFFHFRKIPKTQFNLVRIRSIYY